MENHHWRFLTFYFSAASEYSLILISFERLRALHRFPMNVSHNPTRRRRTWLSIFAAWVIPFAFQRPKAACLLEFKSEREPVIGNYCRFIWGRTPTLRAKIYGGVILIAEGIVPLVIFIYSFYNIRKYLSKEEKRVSGQTQGTPFSDGYKYYICWQIMERDTEQFRF